MERRAGGGWEPYTDDLGLQILWSVRKPDGDDRRTVYNARWEAPIDAPEGDYRMLVKANLYTLRSDEFELRSSNDLEPRVEHPRPGRAVISLGYPEPVPNQDFTDRPRHAKRPNIELSGDTDGVTAKREGSEVVVTGRPGTELRIRGGDARDEHGNANRSGADVEL